MTTEKKPIDQELRQVCEAFRIQGAFQSFEEIKVGNVNRTYRVDYIRDDGKPKPAIWTGGSSGCFPKTPTLSYAA